MNIYMYHNYLACQSAFSYTQQQQRLMERNGNFLMRSGTSIFMVRLVSHFHLLRLSLLRSASYQVIIHSHEFKFNLLVECFHENEIVFKVNCLSFEQLLKLFFRHMFLRNEYVLIITEATTSPFRLSTSFNARRKKRTHKSFAC